jgi:hypothetical protein
MKTSNLCQTLIIAISYDSQFSCSDVFDHEPKDCDEAYEMLSKTRNLRDCFNKKMVDEILVVSNGLKVQQYVVE